MPQGTVAWTTVWIIIQKEGRIKKSVTSGCRNLKGQEIGVYSMDLESDIYGENSIGENQGQFFL